MEIKLAELADGAVAERFNLEMQRVLDNIMDPNTDPKKVRTLTLKISFKADENRDIVTANIDTKANLAPVVGIGTKFLLDRDGNGNVVGAELIQTSLFRKDEDPRPASNVSYMERKQNGQA